MNYMNKVTQRYLHEPDKGIYGDCWAACIASITEIPLEEIPDPNDPANKEWSIYWVNMWNFLQEKGYNLYVEDVHKFKGNGNPVMAIGKSPRCVGENADLYHAVVWNDGIIHDPHPDNTGIHSIIHFEIIENI